MRAWVWAGAAAASVLSLRAESFAWNSDINLRLFADAANWHAGSGVASRPPGPGDDIVTPLQYGVVSISGQQEVRNLEVQLEKKWFLIGKGTTTFTGDFIKGGGQELVVRDGGLANIEFNVGVEGKLVLEAGTLRLGQETENGELHGLAVKGLARVEDGTLLVRSTDARFEGGIFVESGTVAVRQGPEPGGLTVGGLEGGEAAVICAATSGTLAPEGTLTIHLPAGSKAFPGVLEDGKGGKLALVKSGSGTQILSGESNTYSGGTVVKEGTLCIDNEKASAVGSGRVAIAGTGILSGRGQVAGPVTVSESGGLAPGTEKNPVASLVLKQGLAVDADTASLRLDLGNRAENSDRITGEGEFSAGGRLVLKISGTPAIRSWPLLTGFSVRKDRHFSSVEVTGAVSGRLTRSGNAWTGGISGLRWSFDEQSGILSVTR